MTSSGKKSPFCQLQWKLVAPAAFVGCVGPRKVTQISYGSTSPALSNKAQLCQISGKSHRAFRFLKPSMILSIVFHLLGTVSNCFNLFYLFCHLIYSTNSVYSVYSTHVVYPSILFTCNFTYSLSLIDSVHILDATHILLTLPGLYPFFYAMTCRVLFDDLRFLTSSKPRRRTRIPTSCALSLLIVSKGRPFGTGSLHLRCGSGSANLAACGFVFHPFKAIWNIAGFFCQTLRSGARNGTTLFSIFPMSTMGAAGTNGCVPLCFGALRWDLVVRELVD